MRYGTDYSYWLDERTGDLWDLYLLRVNKNVRRKRSCNYVRVHKIFTFRDPQLKYQYSKILKHGNKVQLLKYCPNME